MNKEPSGIFSIAGVGPVTFRCFIGMHPWRYDDFAIQSTGRIVRTCTACGLREMR